MHRTVLILCLLAVASGCTATNSGESPRQSGEPDMPSQSLPSDSETLQTESEPSFTDTPFGLPDSSSTGSQIIERIEESNAVWDSEATEEDARSVVKFGPFKAVQMSRPVRLVYREPVAEENFRFVAYAAASANVGMSIELDAPFAGTFASIEISRMTEARLWLTDQQGVEHTQQHAVGGWMDITLDGDTITIDLMDVVLGPTRDPASEDLLSAPIDGRISGEVGHACFERSENPGLPFVGLDAGLTASHDPAYSLVLDANWSSDFCAKYRQGY